MNPVLAIYLSGNSFTKVDKNLKTQHEQLFCMVAANFTEVVASIASYVATLCNMCSFLVLLYIVKV